MSSRKPNSQYNLAAPDGLAVRVATWQRRKMYQRFINDTDITEADTILDIGVTSDKSYESSNYLEAWHPYKDKITAAGIDDASFLEQQYPGIRFVSQTAATCRLPIARSTSFIPLRCWSTSEVRPTRLDYIGECARVARKAIFLTTPNRWFPIEFHTLLPLAHWLPKPVFRSFLRRTGKNFFADEGNLNLLTGSELRALAAVQGDFATDVSSVALVGWPSNLLLVGRRINGDRRAKEHR